jgi:D-glycero-D-manno-heptose 1,7-bisphosphate phosphatase
VLPPGILKYIRNNKKTALEKEIFPQIIREKRVFGYNSPEYIKDMGTPERLKEVAKDYSKGKVGRLNLRNKRKAIFLDRDGTINYDGGNISKIEDFRLLPKTAEAIKLINTSEYLAVVVTNQPVVAKGFCSISDVEKIHKKMETLLGIKGAKLDAIYFCPHHPDRGYPGENPKYKIKCGCRKPKIGLLKKAQKDLNIDLSKSWIIGDSERDITAGKNAGIRKILIKKNQIKFGECPIKTQTANDIYSAVKLILKKQ